MKITNKNIKIVVITFLIGMLYCNDIAYPQDKIFTIEKGTKTFTVSSTGDSFNWFLNGVKLPVTSGVYTSTFTTGNYNLDILPHSGGCAGDTFKILLKVKDTITIGDGQVVFTSSDVEVCPPSDAVPSSQEIIVKVRFYGYTLKSGEYYRFMYSVNNQPPNVTEPANSEEVILFIPIVDLSPGTHLLQITRLEYGANFINIVDYSTSRFIPTMTITVKTVPPIGEIEF